MMVELKLCASLKGDSRRINRTSFCMLTKNCVNYIAKLP